MRAFADLLERLLFAPGRNTKIALLQHYFATSPDPERGYALAAIAGALSVPGAKPAVLKAMTEARTDPVLFALSYDFVGDLAETIALIWPPAPAGEAPGLGEVVAVLRRAEKGKIAGLIAGWLDVCSPSERIALIKLLTGGLRVGASVRLAHVALAAWGGVEVSEIEEIWHSLEPPYTALFAWLAGGEKPVAGGKPVFRSVMLAHPITVAELEGLDWGAVRAEWKYDGIRVQIVATPAEKRIYSRNAEDISGAFPDVLAAVDFDAVLDGELLVVRDGVVAPFGDLQQRLNRKIAPPALQASHPAGVILYDMLVDAGEDLRGADFDTRRARLEAWFERERPARFSVSPLIGFASPDELAVLRAGARAASIEGVMLKRGDSPYLAGRPKGYWWKWKRDPLSLDAVLMYAERGHGKRSSFYSDYTFGVWTEAGELVPVGKAYSGYTDAELDYLDKWIRNHTVNKFGPVREVEKALVFEVGFDAVQVSSRHKAGVALRFPRILRLRLDKPAAEADRLAAVKALI